MSLSYLFLEFVKKYNSSYHRVIKTEPRLVNRDNEKEIYEKCYNHPITIKSETRFKVNDFVRINKYKHVFEKG